MSPPSGHPEGKLFTRWAFLGDPVVWNGYAWVSSCY